MRGARLSEDEKLVITLRRFERLLRDFIAATITEKIGKAGGTWRINFFYGDISINERIFLKNEEIVIRLDVVPSFLRDARSLTVGRKCQGR